MPFRSRKFQEHLIPSRVEIGGDNKPAIVAIGLNSPWLRDPACVPASRVSCMKKPRTLTLAGARRSLLRFGGVRGHVWGAEP